MRFRACATPARTPAEGRRAFREARRRRWRLFLEMAADVVDRLLHCRDLLGFFVRNLGFEFLFEGHHKLDRVEGVGAEIVDERRFVLDFRFVDASCSATIFLTRCSTLSCSSPCRGPRINREFYQIAARLPVTSCTCRR